MTGTMVEEGLNRETFEDPWPAHRAGPVPSGAFIVDLGGFEACRWVVQSRFGCRPGGGVRTSGKPATRLSDVPCDVSPPACSPPRALRRRSVR